LEEAALIQALKEGNSEAFRLLVSDHGDRVYNTVLGMMQSPEDAEDVVQEVFISVFQNVGRFRGDAKLGTWMYRIAITKSLEALRRKSLKQSRMNTELKDADSLHAAPFQHPGVTLENREKAGILFRALERLPETQKTAFVLHKTEGLSYAEIGDIMEITLPAVESLIYRARQRLQKLLATFYHNT
jgi:RNA polymerase sigma-70 factor (ECF subfamily)